MLDFFIDNILFSLEDVFFGRGIPMGTNGAPLLEFLIDNILLSLVDVFFSRGIPMGTNSAPLLADLFRYSY